MDEATARISEEKARWHMTLANHGRELGVKRYGKTTTSAGKHEKHRIRFQKARKTCHREENPNAVREEVKAQITAFFRVRR